MGHAVLKFGISLARPSPTKSMLYYCTIVHWQHNTNQNNERSVVAGQVSCEDGLMLEASFNYYCIYLTMKHLTIISNYRNLTFTLDLANLLSVHSSDLLLFRYAFNWLDHGHDEDGQHLLEVAGQEPDVHSGPGQPAVCPQF